MKISVIIPAYYIDQDYVDMTQDCVNSVKATSNPDQIIVVNDGSPVKADIDFAINVHLPENLGFAGAVRAGYDVAEGDVIIVLNNDTLTLDGWLEGLLEPIQMGYDIVSIRTTDCDGYEKEDKITEGDKFGSCWAIRSTVWHDLGGLSTEFGRGYAEDLDLWKRAIQKGYRIAKNHNAIVFHEGKKTFSEIDPDDTLYTDALMKYKDKHGTID